MTARIAYEWFPQVLNMSVTAAIVVLFVLLARLLLRKTPKVFSYALWAVVLFRLLCPVSVTAGFSLLALADAPARATTAYTTAVEYVRPAVTAPKAPLTQTQTPAEAGSPAAPNAGAQGEAPAIGAWGPMEAAAGLWLLGMLGMALYSVGAYVGVRRRLVGAVKLRENLYLADHIPSPFVMGLFRPKIYLPSALSAREQGYIIRHEQCHIRRGDHIVKALSFLALCIHWFNPLVWAAFLLSGKDMEMSCDEAVVGQMGEGVRADYSASLLSLATGRRIIAGTPLAFGEGDTKGRIRNLARWEAPRRWAALLAAVVCVAVAAACAANPHEAEKQGRGRYASMQDFAQKTMDEVKTVTYYTTGGGEATATVTATKQAWLDKHGQVEDLAPEGVLEAWTFHYLVQVDADDVGLVGGMYEEDGWYDLEGQGGHNVVSLRYEDGTYDVLYNQIVNDNLDFYGYHNSYEEAIYDWYVTDQGLDLPLYVEDWIDRIGAAAESMGNFPVHRYDGDGWYLYIPVSAWVRGEGYGDSWQSAYGTGSTLTVYKQDQSARAMADYLVGVGWVEVEGPVPHVKHWETPIEDYYFDAPDGGSYQVRIEWQEQNITDYPFIAIEPDTLRAMAERFTVDPSRGAEPVPVETPDPGPLSALAEGDAITLSLTRDGGETGAYRDCWDESNAVYYFRNLAELTWEAAAAGAGEPAGDSVTLAWGDGLSLTAYRDREEVLISGPDGQSWLRPVGEEDAYTPYEALRGWFDEAEYTALGGGYEVQDIVIPDEGQDYLEAAAAYVAAFEGIHLQATTGSKYCYSYVSTSVEGAEETTAAFRERGGIDENTYAFYLNTVFVPENEQAANWSWAGNTGEYTGGDPAVPEGALEYSRCGFVTLEADGWHGNLVGTGW